MHQPGRKDRQGPGLYLDVVDKLVELVLLAYAWLDYVALWPRVMERDHVDLVGHVDIVDAAENVVWVAVRRMLRAGRIEIGPASAVAQALHNLVALR